MKKILLLVIAALAAGLFGGCAGWPTYRNDDRVEVVDHRRMQFIEEQARRSGVSVIWLRPSTKLVDRATASASSGS